MEVLQSTIACRCEAVSHSLVLRKMPPTCNRQSVVCCDRWRMQQTYGLLLAKSEALLYLCSGVAVLWVEGGWRSSEPCVNTKPAATMAKQYHIQLRLK